jgi:amino acid efflux transporter
MLGGQAIGLVTTAQLVALPTTLFLTVYLGCTAAAARMFTGATRATGVLSCAAVLGVLAFGGWALLVALVIVVVALTKDPESAATADVSAALPTERDATRRSDLVQACAQPAT